MRIVLDTNVVMSALLWRGAPYQLLTALREHPTAQLCSSLVLLTELTEVLGRPAASGQLARISSAARTVVADYLDIIELIEPTAIPRTSRDPDDDRVLACALAAQAEFIVSGDRDLLSLDTFQGIAIVTPAEALRRIKAQP